MFPIHLPDPSSPQLQQPDSSAITSEPVFISLSSLMSAQASLLSVCAFYAWVCVRGYVWTDAYPSVHCRFWQVIVVVGVGGGGKRETESGQWVAELPAASVREAGCLRKDFRALGKYWHHQLGFLSSRKAASCKYFIHSCTHKRWQICLLLWVWVKLLTAVSSWRPNYHIRSAFAVQRCDFTLTLNGFLFLQTVAWNRNSA